MPVEPAGIECCCYPRREQELSDCQRRTIRSHSRKPCGDFARFRRSSLGVMEGPQIPIQNHALTARKTDLHAGRRRFQPQVRCKRMFGPQGQHLAKPSVTVVFEDDVSAGLKLQLVL